MENKLNSILERKKNMLNLARGHHKRWERNKDAHLITKRNDAAKKALGLSNLRLPFEFSYVEAKCSAEIETLPIVKVTGVEKGDNLTAEHWGKIFDYVMEKVVKINSVYYRMHPIKNVYGDAFLKVYWHTDEREVQCPKVKYEGKGKDKKRVIEFEKKKVTYYDNIRVDVLKPTQVLVDPICFQAGKTIDDANVVGFNYIYSLDFVKKTFLPGFGWKNIEKIQEGTPDSDTNAPTKEEQRARSEAQMVDIYEEWNLLDDTVTYIVNDSIIVKESPIPYYNKKTGLKMLPLAHFCGHYIGDGMYNYGEVDLTIELAEENETMRNINLDSAKLGTSPFIIKPTEMDLETDGFRLGSNMVMETEDPSALKVVQLSGNNTLPFNLERANQESAIMATGFDVASVVSGKSETATKTVDRKETEVVRTRYNTKFNELNGYPRLFELIKNMILQFYTPEMISKILGEESTILDAKAMFEEEFDILITTNNTIPASREMDKIRKQELLAVLGSLPFNPQTGELPNHLKPVVADLLVSLGVDTAKYPMIFEPTAPEVPTEPEMDPEMQETIDALKAEGIDVGDDPMGEPAEVDPTEEVENFIRPSNAPKGMSNSIQSEIQTYIQPNTPR